MCRQRGCNQRVCAGGEGRNHTCTHLFDLGHKGRQRVTREPPDFEGAGQVQRHSRGSYREAHGGQVDFSTVAAAGSIMQLQCDEFEVWRCTGRHTGFVPADCIQLLQQGSEVGQAGALCGVRAEQRLHSRLCSSRVCVESSAWLTGKWRINKQHGCVLAAAGGHVIPLCAHSY